MSGETLALKLILAGNPIGGLSLIGNTCWTVDGSLWFFACKHPRKPEIDTPV